MVLPIGTLQPGLTMQRLVPLSGIYPSASSDNSAMPLGVVRTFAGFANGGAAVARGQLLDIGTNPALFQLIGITYGGDGQETFALPDLDYRVAMGTGAGPGLDAVNLGQQDGAAEVFLSQANLPPGWGGTSTPFDEDQPSLGIRHLIRVEGIFSGPDSGGAINSIAMVVPWLSPLTPGGFLECNGQLLAISEYDALFALIGTTYGGDGETTFALPDLRGRTIIGQGGGHVMGEMSGQGPVALLPSQLPTDMGGGGQPALNADPSLTMNYIIALTGIFPGQGGLYGEDRYIGEVMAFAAAHAPRGWAICQGQLLAIAQNQALFSLLGTTYGGDGRVTFALPDLRGRDIIGTGEAVLGERLGNATFGVGLDQVPGLDYDGSAAADMLYGANEADTVRGLNGNDQIRSWAGADILAGNGGDDYLSGNADADRLFGGAGKDRLLGGTGGDFLAGGANRDELWGGGNGDRFIFDTLPTGNDLIHDFSAAGGDKLRIDASVFGGGLAAGALDAARLVVGGGVNQAFGQFIFKISTGQLRWDADGNGAGTAVNITRLFDGGMAVGSLTAGDFEIVV